MNRRFAACAAVAAAGAFLVGTGSAGAHPSTFTADSWINSGLGVHWNSHGAAGSEAGRQSVPPVEEGLDLVSSFNLGGKLGGDGRVADVSAKGDYAYLTMFYEPACGRGGVQIVDMNLGTPEDDTEAVGYIPSHVDTFSGEGSQVVTLDTPSFKGDLLVYQNEWCPGTTNGVGGITLVDVTNPRNPKKLVEGAGDFTLKARGAAKGVPQTKANQTHSAFAWTQARTTGRVFVVLVDDLEEDDIDILDITNPSKPKKVSETNLQQFAQTGTGRPHGDAVFSHDMVVKRIGGRDIMLMSYWDGGYVTLDVTDPANPEPLSDTDFAASDPARAELGQTITPEGNAHEAEFTRDNEFFFATDEDFNPYRVQATFKGGPAAGKVFTAIQGATRSRSTRTTRWPATREFLGLGCDPVAPAAGARADRRRRARRLRLPGQAGQHRGRGLRGPDRVQPHRRGRLRDARLDARRLGDDAGDLRLAHGRLPPARRRARRELRVQRRDGSGTPTPAGPSVPVDISAVFDGWGYTHMYRTDLTRGREDAGGRLSTRRRRARTRASPRTSAT